MNHDKYSPRDEEERQLVLDFENTVLQGREQFFDVDELEIIIDYYLEVNDFDPLEQAVSYAEKLYPDSLEVRLRRAHVYIAHSQFDQALPILTELRRREPNNTDVAYSLGVLYGAMEQPQKAIDYFMQASEDGWDLGRIYANIAEEYYNMNQLDEALRYFQLSLDTDSYESSTIYGYVDTLLQTPHVDDGIEYLQSFVGEHPYCAEAWHGLGLLQASLCCYEKAEDSYEYAIAIDNQLDKIYYDLAYCQEQAGQPYRAIATLLRHAELSPNAANDYVIIGRTLIFHKNYPAAYDYLRRAYELSPDNAIVCCTFALSCIYLDDRSQALSLLRRAIRLDNKSGEVYFTAALIYDIMGNVEMADDSYGRLFELDESEVHEDMYRSYVDFLFRQQWFDDVIDSCQNFFEVDPDNDFYASYLAAAYFSTNRYHRMLDVMPYVSPSVIGEICPAMLEHPLVSAMMPDEKNIHS